MRCFADGGVSIRSDLSFVFWTVLSFVARVDGYHSLCPSWIAASSRCGGLSIAARGHGVPAVSQCIQTV